MLLVGEGELQMTFKDQLVKMDACADAVKWVGDRTMDQAWAECVKAGVECVKAGVECEPELMALHREEYPETKWNGQTIFPEAK